MKEKILFIHNSLPEYRYKLWQDLSKEITVDILVINKEFEKKIYKFNHGELGLDVDYWNVKSVKKLYRSLSEYTAIVLPAVDSLKEWVCCIIMLLIRYGCRNKIPFVYWNEKWEPEIEKQPFGKRIKNKIQRIMIKTIAKRCEKIVVSGVKSSEYITTCLKFPKSSVKTIIDSSTSPKPLMKYDIKEKHGISDSNKIVLYLGRLVYRKGCLFLINCMKDYLEDKEITLLICGDGEELKKCKEMSEGMKNIVFAGMIQPSERKNYYEQSDYFVLPSICDKGIIEAWGLTLNEALECGMSVIASDIVGSAHDLINQNNGYIFNENNKDDFIHKLNTMINKKYNRATIKADYEKYSVREMAEGFADLFKNLV